MDACGPRGAAPKSSSYRLVAGSSPAGRTRIFTIWQGSPAKPVGMADAVHLGQAADGASADTPGHRTHRHAHTHTRSPASFQQTLLRALQGKGAVRRVTGRGSCLAFAI